MTTHPQINSTRELVALYRKENELLEIEEEIDPCLEIAAVQRRVVAQKGKALLFKNVKGCKFQVATNLLGSQKRIELALTTRPEQLLKDLKQTIDTIFPLKFGKLWRARTLASQFLKVGCRTVRDGPILKEQIPGANLLELPQIKSWSQDGGPFITLPLVYTQGPQSGKPNLGMYRIQMFGENECGMHIQIHRGGGFHYHEAEQHAQSLPVHIYIGGAPALIIAAVAPLPEDVSELLLASLLSGGRVKQVMRPGLSPLPILAEADFCIIGDIPPFERRPEGPFGDHYGYYSLQHDYPYVKVRHILHRKDAIYPATVVGRPPQEDHFIACYLQELLKPMISIVMPQVREVWAYEETGVHSLAAAVVKDRYPREALTTALRILGEGQLSLTKVLMVTDQPCDVKNFREFFQIVLARLDFSRDLFVLSQISQDTLDYTGPRINEGSKAIFLAVGAPIRDLPANFSGEFSSHVFTEHHVFCPGALVVFGPAFQKNDGVPEMLAKEKALKDWPMVFLLDQTVEDLTVPENFLWQVFTRFEPAADIYAYGVSVRRYHLCLKPPVVIDCRMKPWYPSVLESDPDVEKRLAPVFAKYDLG